MPMTPTGSRVISTSRPGRTDAPFSPISRSASPAKNAKICPARATSPMPSGSVLPSSRASRRPSSSLRARISTEILVSASKRSCGVERAQAGKAAFAAAIAFSVCALSALAYSPTTSAVLEGLMSRVMLVPSIPFAGDEVLLVSGHVSTFLVSARGRDACRRRSSRGSGTAWPARRRGRRGHAACIARSPPRWQRDRARCRGPADPGSRSCRP
ncbi:hypothetical protein ACVWW1_008128 [Bradyrhizobium sp. JR3.5]